MENFGSNREDVTVLINLYARRRSEHENLEVAWTKNMSGSNLFVRA